MDYPEHLSDSNSDDVKESEPDELTDKGTMYLLEERLENLREAVGLSVDEIMELRYLESFLKLHEDNKGAIPENLGTPSKEDQLVAALEFKRDDRYADEEYAGGEIEDEEESVSSVNQYYQTLFQESRLNLKSFTLLASDKAHVLSNRGKDLTVYNLYETLPPDYDFEEYLASVWKIPADAFEKFSDTKQYEYREKWQQYQEDRTLNAPSPFQQVIMRCTEIVASPIYDDMQEIKEEHYRLTNGMEFYFTDKTAVFTIPVSQFEDIPMKSSYPQVAFFHVAFTIPEYAHEKKRFFKKHGTVKELCEFLTRLGVALSEKQTAFLHDLVKDGTLRLYREVLELPDRDEIRAYFLNITKNFGQYSKHYLQTCLQDRLKQEDTIIVRMVTPFHTWYPEWMRKIGGFIIEEKYGNSVAVPRPLRVAVDEKLPQYAFKHEHILMPSNRISHLSPTEWSSAFVAEMRAAYKVNPKIFRKYAEDFEMKKIELRCSCKNHGSPHQERCPIPTLENIFQKIREDMKKIVNPL